MVTFSVPKMHCGRCQATVEAALKPIEGTRWVRVDLETRQVSVGGPVPVDVLAAALDRAGFPGTPVEA